MPETGDSHMLNAALLAIRQFDSGFGFVSADARRFAAFWARLWLTPARLLSAGFARLRYGVFALARMAAAFYAGLRLKRFAVSALPRLPWPSSLPRVMAYSGRMRLPTTTPQPAAFKAGRYAGVGFRLRSWRSVRSFDSKCPNEILAASA
ncbi:hypothetical protein Metme_3607 [Methylomonas methanica MC09]|uniref:Uncharacterized protein n=1 Tax=Methylomonas methanica (strain DSM 25384 / MC09) TaxID=857087 RepID=F9ZVI7_METMM|nr:hypothetical protein Metme_3607 [Methylomonas methanica MC09]